MASEMTFFDDLDDKIDGASSCHGKQSYSEKSAQAAAIRMAQKKAEPFEAYKCRHCEHWHIGHPRFWGWTDEQVAAATVTITVRSNDETDSDSDE